MSKAGHWLDAMLRPASVALVGASAKPGSVGNDIVRVLRDGGFRGAIYPVNPNYHEIDGLRCYPTVGDLPAAPDLALLGVSAERMEAAMDGAVAGGARSIVILDSCYLEDDAEPKLHERLRQKARAAGIPVCGGNGMGFYNFDAATHISYQHPPERPAGHIALIAHSGSVFVLLAGNDPRYRFNLVVSSGQELNGTVADYIDYALDQPTTRVIALFIETVRDPAAFVKSLQKARERNVPIIVAKVGRTEESARLAATHCGVLAGNDAAYEAVFDRYGVLRVDTLDGLMAGSLLMSQLQRAAAGGLAGLTDSGGLRELMIDLADQVGVRLAQISAATQAKLRARLPPHLAAVNPLDAAGALRPDFADIFKDCLQILIDDPDTAIGVFEFEVRDHFVYMPALLETAKSMPTRTAKPFVVLNSFSAAQNSRTAVELLDAGVPMINGVQNMLGAVRLAFAYRDHGLRPLMAPPPGPGALTVDRWRRRLSQEATLDEAESLAMLSDFGVPTAEARIADSTVSAAAVAASLGFPVALKTAMPGIHHKSDVDGVRLGLGDPEAVHAAYRDLAARLGPRVTIEPMIAPGVELAFGMTIDPDFGPMVMVGSGGRWIEVLRDRVFALPPFDHAEARRLIDRLTIRPLLDGGRGVPPADIDGLCQALARFSVLVSEMAELVAEIDANPIVVGPRGAVAVDAVVIGRRAAVVGRLETA
jgi:acyl-CoA synthetase (NDP forming)